MHTLQRDVSDPALAIAGMEAGQLEIRPGQSNALKAMSWVAPEFMLKQRVQMTTPKNKPTHI